MNYMDYVDDDTMFMFTSGRKSACTRRSRGRGSPFLK